MTTKTLGKVLHDADEYLCDWDKRPPEHQQKFEVLAQAVVDAYVAGIEGSSTIVPVAPPDDVLLRMHESMYDVRKMPWRDGLRVVYRAAIGLPPAAEVKP